MNRRRAVLAGLLALGLPRPGRAEQRDPETAQIRYGPVLATCPEGQRYWLIATAAGAFPIPDYDVIARLPVPQFAAIVRACGEWTLIDGEPNKWNHAQERWEMAIL